MRSFIDKLPEVKHGMITASVLPQPQAWLLNITARMFNLRYNLHYVLSPSIVKIPIMRISTKNREIELLKQRFFQTTKKVYQKDKKFNFQLFGKLFLLLQALRWAKSACEDSGEDANDGKNIRSKLGTALNLIRFPAMSTKEFAEIVGLFLLSYANITAIFGQVQLAF